MGAGKGNAFQNFLKCQVRARAQGKVGRAHIDRIGSVQDRDLQFFQRSHWHEQLGSFLHEVLTGDCLPHPNRQDMEWGLSSGQAFPVAILACVSKDFERRLCFLPVSARQVSFWKPSGTAGPGKASGDFVSLSIL